MVESTALEMRRAREGTQGSNPCLSANYPSTGVHIPPPILTLSPENREFDASVCSQSSAGFHRWQGIK